MKNKKMFGALSLVLLTALSGCNKDKRTTVQFWTGFGGPVNSVLNPLLARFEEKNPDIKVQYESKGGYDNLLQAMTASISNNKYPHIANGYPDHFATYANSNILIDLDMKPAASNPDRLLFINNPDPNIGVKVDQYLPNYLKENMDLIDGAITGLPFNKSTEIMVANQTFFDVASQFDEDIKIPETWQELAIVGTKIKDVAKLKGWFGKLVKPDGTTVAKPEKPTEEELAALIPTIAFDMSEVSEKQFRPFSWDSSANWFITILRQWNAEYTKRGEENFQTGEMLFHKEPNLAKALAALTFFQQLYQDGIVGLPITFGESLYSSTPFIKGKLVLTISSSAGIGENIPDDTTFPFKVSVNPIPYNGDNAEGKYVIAQGTNLALFTRGKISDETTRKERAAAWRLLRYLSYEVNFEFGQGTSYFPVIDGLKIAKDENDSRYQDYVRYQNFLASTPEEIEKLDGTERAIRDTALLEAEKYQAVDDEGEKIWKQFVDPGFNGSSRIRQEVSFIMGQIFADKMTPQKAIDGVVSKLPLYA